MPSAVIRYFAYEPDRRELKITFQSGRRYVYEGVPPEVHEALKGALSRGEFFNEHIRDRFRFRREES